MENGGSLGEENEVKQEEKPAEEVVSAGSVLGIFSGLFSKIDKKQLFILIIIFLLAFGVRAHMMRYDLMFGFDSYFHARIVADTIQNGHWADTDMMAYYQIGGADMTRGGSPVFWFLTAFIYKIFTFGAPYNKDVWILFAKLLPAIFGALICVAVYFFMKEAYGRKAGYAAAFFAAVSASFVYRTMTGFFEEDSLGFLWMILGFYFFVKAVKHAEFNKESIKNILLASAFFAILGWTWEMFLMVPLVLIAYTLTTLVTMWFRKDKSKAIMSIGALVLISFIVFGSVVAVHDGGSWLDRMLSYTSQYAPITQENIERGQSKGGGVLAQTIGEENLGKFFWGTKYNALIVFPFVAMGLILYRIWRRKDDRVSWLLFFWAGLTLFMAWNKLKFTYTLGLPVAVTAGFVFYEVFELIKTRNPVEKKSIAVALGLMALIGVGSATLFVTEHYPNIELNNGWKEALSWMKENTPEDAKFFNWWDEGHWTTFLGERAVVEDNRNMSMDSTSAVAQFLLAEDENAAYALVKNFESDYVIFSSDLLMKLNSMGMYAYITTDTSDPRLRKYFGVDFQCGEGTDSLSGQKVYSCGANRLQEPQYDALPTVWTNIPNQLQEGQIPLFVYRSKEKNRLYIINAETNNAFLGKLWFNDPSIEHFEEVYSNGGVKIFKVN